MKGFKNAAEMKWYLYRSDAKLRMLYPQIGSRGDARKTIEWKLSAGVGSLSRKVEREETVDEDDMLKAVMQELEEAGQVGTVYEPNL